MCSSPSSPSPSPSPSSSAPPPHAEQSLPPTRDPHRHRLCLQGWECSCLPKGNQIPVSFSSLIIPPSPKDASCRCRIIRSVPAPAWIWLCNTGRQWCWPSSAIGGPDRHNPSVSNLAAAAWQVPAYHRYAHLSNPPCGSMLTRSRSASRSLLQSSFLT